MEVFGSQRLLFLASGSLVSLFVSSLSLDTSCTKLNMFDNKAGEEDTPFLPYTGWHFLRGVNIVKIQKFVSTDQHHSIMYCVNRCLVLRKRFYLPCKMVQCPVTRCITVTKAVSFLLSDTYDSVQHGCKQICTMHAIPMMFEGQDNGGSS